MPNVLTIFGYRFVIYPGDHPPARVHVIGKGVEAVFKLNCPDGPSILRNKYGIPSKDLRRISAEVNARVPQMCEIWRAINGNY